MTVRCSRRSWGCLILAALAVSALGMRHCEAGALFTEGHGHIGPHYANHGGHAHFHLHMALEEGSVVGGVPLPGPGETEFDPSEILTAVPATGAVQPAGSEWNFIGAGSGNSYFRLPETEIGGVPSLAIVTEELIPSEWTGPITFTLESIVSGPPGGQVSLWVNDIGGPIVKFSTFAGISSFELDPGEHLHVNWGFTQPGIYQVKIGVSGTNATDGFAAGSDVFTFVVAVPEPGSLALSGIAALTMGVVAIRRRRSSRPSRGPEWTT